MEQPKEIETNQYEREIEAGDMETKEYEKKNINPRRANTGKVVEHLVKKFGEKTYDTQLNTSTWDNKKRFYA